MNKKISTPLAISIIVVLAVIVGGGILGYQYYLAPKISEQPKIEIKKSAEKPVVCTQEAKVCPSGFIVGRIGPNCEFETCPDTLDKRIYNHAGKIVKAYQKNGKQYLDIDFIKYLFFFDVNGHMQSIPTAIYGENDENGDCKPVADPYCIINNNKTVQSYEAAKNIEIITNNIPGLDITFENLEEVIKTNPYFKIEIGNNIVQRIGQLYIP